MENFHLQVQQEDKEIEELNSKVAGLEAIDFSNGGSWKVRVVLLTVLGLIARKIVKLVMGYLSKRKSKKEGLERLAAPEGQLRQLKANKIIEALSGEHAGKMAFFLPVLDASILKGEDICLAYSQLASQSTLSHTLSDTAAAILSSNTGSCIDHYTRIVDALNAGDLKSVAIDSHIQLTFDIIDKNMKEVEDTFATSRRSMSSLLCNGPSNLIYKTYNISFEARWPSGDILYSAKRLKQDIIDALNSRGGIVSIDSAKKKLLESAKDPAKLSSPLSATGRSIERLDELVGEGATLLNKFQKSGKEVIDIKERLERYSKKIEWLSQQIAMLKNQKLSDHFNAWTKSTNDFIAFLSTVAEIDSHLALALITVDRIMNSSDSKIAIGNENYDYDMQHLDWIVDRAAAMDRDPEEWQFQLGLTKEVVNDIDGANQQCQSTMQKVAALESIHQQIVTRGEMTLSDIRAMERIRPGIVYNNAMVSSQLGQPTSYGLVAGNEFIFTILKWGILAVIIGAIVKMVRWVRAVYLKNVKPSVQAGKSIMDAVRDHPFVKKMMEEMNDLADPAMPPDERVAKFTSSASDALKDQIKDAASKVVDDKIAGFNETVKTQTAGTFKCNQKPANDRVTKMLNDQLREIGCTEAEYGFTNDVKSCFIEFYQLVTAKHPSGLPKGSFSIIRMSRLTNDDFMTMLRDLRLIFVTPQVYSAAILVEPDKALPLIRSQLTGLERGQSLVPQIEELINEVNDRLKDDNPNWDITAREMSKKLSEMHRSFEAVVKDLMATQRSDILQYQNFDMGNSPRTILPLVSINDRAVNEHLSMMDKIFTFEGKRLADIREMTATIGGEKSESMAQTLSEVRERVLLLKDPEMPDRLTKRLAEVQKNHSAVMDKFTAEFKARYPGRSRPFTDLDDRPIPGPYELGTILNNLSKLLDLYRKLCISTTKTLHHVTLVSDCISGDMQMYVDLGKHRIELMARLNANKALFEKINKLVS